MPIAVTVGDGSLNLVGVEKVGGAGVTG
jgi:hypothetical protein